MIRIFALLFSIFMFFGGSVSAKDLFKHKYFVCFSPDHCDKKLIQILDNSTHEVDVAIYSFTNYDIANELIKLANEGVNVKVVVDKHNTYSRTSVYDKLIFHDIDVRVPIVNRGLMHNKYVIIDDKIVCTGSFNWSYAAAHHNYENLICIKDRKLAKIYKKNFKELWKRSVR